MFNILEKTEKLHDVLIFHGDADEIVPVSNAFDIYDHALDPKLLIIHRNGDHQMTSKKDQIQFEIESLSWFLKCFDKCG